ncbi:DNA-binding transcriptional regulator, MarR family [Actinacidiphila rubida]|uniref:DNA-binding transcriptional regulator, MarR family n=2 Tax=Actinacidiphila rubida TaxID=310780 RepID=A0A1H8LYS2_9ACTN|nr:DNA-binding transcriptional regulator, MarR family [Actinacidiphila rubida]
MSLTASLLTAATVLVDDIHSGVAARGYTDIRPTHGFVFSRLSEAGATVTEVAEHLGVTRQAASQIVDELVAKGYVERRPHPSDARARLVVLTERGVRCTWAAEDAAVDALESWEDILGEQRLLAMRDELVRLAPNGPLRPAW